jgi:hypothetical protein
VSPGFTADEILLMLEALAKYGPNTDRVGRLKAKLSILLEVARRKERA